MRVKDEFKQEAVFNATVKLVNEIGFAASSVAKIAREAGVSPATIYIYYKNKEDLLVSTYIEIKQRLSEAMLKDFDDTLPIRDILERIWRNTFAFIAENPALFHYTEQFANSPYSDLVDKKEVEKQFEPIINILQRGIEQKIIKNVPFDILSAFIFYPALILSNARLCPDIQLNEETIETAFTLAWDAIKL
ncbi:MAG: TetR/AcrR family transcriptional regulator [Methanobacteriota archaeon]|nr:MAG: TetR/AcrR family transcriptional regulator [Euryarchaeota archaeon]